MTPQERASSIRADLTRVTENIIALKADGYDPRITGLDSRGTLSNFLKRGESIGLKCFKTVTCVESL